MKLNSQEVSKALANALDDAAQRFNASYNPEEDKHGLTILESCSLSCERYNLSPEFADLMLLLLSENWNQCLEWADSIKK